MDQMKDKKKYATELFAKGFNCAQSVIAPYAPHIGLEEESALKIASALGGGMAGCGETCGAVSGALLTIGYQLSDATVETKLSVKQKSQEFIKKFKDLHGTTMCRELLQCDISTEAGKEQAEREQLFAKLCPRYVSSSVEILGEII